MIERLYRTGFGQRYAMHPEMAWTAQTLAHHQWGVAVLLLKLFPDLSPVLLEEALLHDTGEPGTADASYVAKQAYPALAEVLDECEAVERADLGVPETYLTDEERAQLELCDRLESYLFAKIRAPHVLERPRWQVMRVRLIQSAARLGVEAQVRGLVS